MAPDLPTPDTANLAADIENFEDASAFVIVVSNDDGSSPTAYGPYADVADVSATYDRLLKERAEDDFSGRTYRIAPVLDSPWT